MSYFNKTKRRLTASVLLLFAALGAVAGPHNIAPKAHATVSSAIDGSGAECVNDGIIRVKGKGNWVSQSGVSFWGEVGQQWVQLTWDEPQTIAKVILYDLPGEGSDIQSGVLTFSDGTTERVLQIPSSGAPKVVEFAPRTVTWMKFESTDADGPNIGLSEIEVYPAIGSYEDYVSCADPYIETTRGRYFFSVTGSQPFGMIGAMPLTRNKNQDGGGYNYNSEYILGFPQIHGWMLCGLNIMPTTGDVDVRGNEDYRKVELNGNGMAWRSRYSHEGEIVQPGYHRVFLDTYNMWVEQTATCRSGMYKLTYCDSGKASLVVNLGGYISTATMTNAHARQVSANRITGWFDTVGRLWGGPDRVRVFFVVESSKPFASVDSWEGATIRNGSGTLEAADEWLPRNEGMSYADAPSTGMRANYSVEAGEEIVVKTAVSYTSVENAVNNLVTENPGWDFAAVRKASQAEWNDWFSRIAVEGGSGAQQVKFYTDLWHALLGRRIIDDASGDYPDYTECDHLEGNFVKGARLNVRKVTTGKDKKPLFHMYNSDALWLSQWNLNILWGLAYPEVLDAFAASFTQYSLNGGLLPRGPNAGGYSFIMSGCPASSLIGSAFQQGLTKKWNPKVALREMKRNHETGGMQGYGYDEGHRFYMRNGYCPDGAGVTIQWAFEDWVLANLAADLGQKALADEYYRRSEGWTKSVHPGIKLVLPRKADGTWTHTDPLNGHGYVEANAWQATFGLSHALPKLANMMGGNDSLCSRLNYAFVQGAKDDFIRGYGNGYVSYANQPGLSNAHVFGHAGKPWLTQYWVRRVQTQAYSGILPDWGYGGHDEDQGQMGALSALMSIGLFSIDGCAAREPRYDITSPIFDTVRIRLDKGYYKGGSVTIKTYGNSPENCYIQKIAFNGRQLGSCSISHKELTAGGTLEIWLGDKPNTDLK